MLEPYIVHVSNSTHDVPSVCSIDWPLDPADVFKALLVRK
jgi:hypothetical protein